jgi:peroxiredoxin family protein
MTPEEINNLVEQKVQQELEKQLKKFRSAQAMTIVASKGTLDMAYPPLILATTAAAMDLETSIFFTFYGLDIINKKKYANLKVPPLGNPAMPVPVPNIIGMLPGMTMVATAMMNSWMAKQNVPSIPQLLDLAREADVKLIGCQMTMDVMGVKREDLIEGVEIGGAATYLGQACQAQINLFV